jgi:hypothetical protein
MILMAQGYAAKTVAGAESSKNGTVSAAQIDYVTKLANAKAEVAEFMAGVEADKAYPSSYRYYKYLAAIGEAYGNAKLVIVGEGIDSSNIYFGSILPTASEK